MRMDDLIKEAAFSTSKATAAPRKFLDKLVHTAWKGPQAVGKGLGYAADKAFRYVGVPVGKASGYAAGQAVKGGAKVLGSNFEKRPIGALGKLAIIGTSVPIITDMTGTTNYFSKLEDSPNYRNPRSLQLSSVSSKLAEDRSMRPSKYLEKTATTKFDATKILNMAVENSVPIAGALGILGLGGAILGPSASQGGEMIKRKLFSPDSILDPQEEIAKSKYKALGKYEADQYVSSLEKKRKQQYELPEVHSVINRLRQSDPLIARASRDPRMRSVIDNTTQAVYSFAPSVAKDDRAMQSVLTEALTSPEGGLSFQTLKSLAETQNYMGNN